MSELKIAVSRSYPDCFSIHHACVSIDESNYINVAVIILPVSDAERGELDEIDATGYDTPVLIAAENEERVPAEHLPRTSSAFEHRESRREFYGHQLEAAANHYKTQLRPPFFRALVDYTNQDNSASDCPGYRGGEFFRCHPASNQFVEYFGKTFFCFDLRNADVAMGDLLIHEGTPYVTQQHATKVFNADETYFVLNGTPSFDKMALDTLLIPGDLVLLDRNNHKSNHHGALLQVGATPVYLETAHNPYGFIGGVGAHCFEESYLRELITEVTPQRAREARPFRLAVIQLDTYDGMIYDARWVVDKIGRLYNYVLFDSVWVGYEQFIPMMVDCSPLLLDFNENGPGILVTQFVREQQADFLQTPQIHRKGNHIKGQQRYVPYKHMNNAFMTHASTSLFYPLFAVLNISAKMHEGVSGRNMWMDCVINDISTRKLTLDNCQYIRPFVSELVDGKPWQSYETAQTAVGPRFFRLVSGEHRRFFEGYTENQYPVDPCKLSLITPSIDVRNGEYEALNIPATILANFLRESSVVPGKCDFDSIFFLLIPTEDMVELQQLAVLLVRFERLLEFDAPLAGVLPSIYKQHEEYYAGYTLRQLCQEMYDLYTRHSVEQPQREMLRKEHFPHVNMNPREADYAYLRGEVELVRLLDAEGRIATEGAPPYPPGVLRVAPGEIWGSAVLHYFSALEERINLPSGLAPKLQSIYIEEHDGRKQV